MNWRGTAICLVVALLLFGAGMVSAQDAPANGAATAPPAAAESAPARATAATAPSEAASVASDLAPSATGPGGLPKVQQRLSVWTMIQSGGVVLWILMALGFTVLVLSIYLFLTLRPSREVPMSLVKRAQSQIRSGDIRGAYQMCQDRDELIAVVLRAGLKMAGHDRYVIQEAMESEGERGATEMWQRVSILNSIGNIAPLLGLLGTVWGMIGAFGAIALDTSQVKGLTMAYYVSMAMVTTAGGIIVAIPAMSAYYYLRGRVIRIVSVVEAQASEFVELIVEHGRQ
jgi:biopolymer transport protein ExbB